VSSDRTRKKLVEQVRSDRRLRTYFEQASDLFFALDRSNRIVAVNPATCKATGYTIKDLIGRNPVDFVVPKARTTVENELQRISRGQRVKRLELEIQTKTGGRINLEIRGGLLHEGRRQIGSFYVARDMTRRKQTDRVLREREERFRSLVQETAAPIALTDTEGKFTYVNQAFAKMLGYSVLELLGLQFKSFLHTEDATRVMELFLRAASSTRETGDLEFRAIHKDGRVLHLYSKPTRLRVEGKTVGFQAIILDITERKRVEHSLTRRYDFERTIAAISSRFVGVSDIDESVKESLRDMGRLSGAGRVYVFMLSEDGNKMSNTHEWCADGVSPQIENLQNLPCETFSWWMTRLRKGEVIHVEDVSKLPLEAAAEKSVLESQDVKSLLVLPVGVGGELAGFIGFDNIVGARRWSEDDYSLLRFSSGILGNALERKLMSDRLHSRAEELSALQATVLEITRRHDLPSLLQAIVERAARLLDAPSGGMYLCDPKKREVRCVVSYMTPRDYIGTVLKYGEGAAGIVAEAGEPLIIDDYRTWSGRAIAYEEEHPFRAVLTVPMIWQSQVTGVIHVLDYSESQHFTQSDLELLSLFANHAAIAVENARLLEQRQRHAQELRAYSSNLEQVVAERTLELSESERRFRELADLLPQIVFEIDTEGNIAFVNRIASEATGYTEKELHEGSNAFMMFPSEHHERARENIRKLLRGEKVSGSEYTIKRKNGSTFPVIVHAAPILREGKAVGLRGIVMDITDRKRMEEALLKSERLAAIGTTAAMVGHDLRNPLQGIASAAYLLKTRLGARNGEQITESLRVIDDCIEYSDKVITDLLEYSAEIHLHLALTSPKSMVQQSLPLVQVPSNVQIDDSSKPSPKLVADREKIRRALLNIIKNAIEAMPEGGSLAISSREADGQVEISFADTGIGMTNETLAKLWTPLFTTKAKGMGFGLAISKRIVEAHGGSIHAKSTFGEGSTFTVRIPIISQELRRMEFSANQ